jgi:hypothetical protein
MGERDANHGEIVKAYEELYCGVIDTHGLGYGFPDILIHLSGYCAPVEIKTAAGELSASQQRFVRDWKGPKIRIVRTRQDVIDHVTELRRRISTL